MYSVWNSDIPFPKKLQLRKEAMLSQSVYKEPPLVSAELLAKTEFIKVGLATSSKCKAPPCQAWALRKTQFSNTGSAIPPIWPIPPKVALEFSKMQPRNICLDLPCSLNRAPAFI